MGMGEVICRVDKNLMAIVGEFATKDLIQLFSADEFKIALERLDFLIKIGSIGMRFEDGKAIYFVTNQN